MWLQAQDKGWSLREQSGLQSSVIDVFMASLTQTHGDDRARDKFSIPQSKYTHPRDNEALAIRTHPDEVHRPPIMVPAGGLTGRHHDYSSLTAHNHVQ